MSNIIHLVKSAYVDENGQTKPHYDGLYSIAGYINRSYFYDRCCKGYNNEDYRHHNCLAQNCPACLRRQIKEDPGYGDFKSWTKPGVYCKECNCWFYGKECFKDHLKKKPQKESAMIKHARKLLQEGIDQDIPPKVIEKSVCESRRKCKFAG